MLGDAQQTVWSARTCGRTSGEGDHQRTRRSAKELPAVELDAGVVVHISGRGIDPVRHRPAALWMAERTRWYVPHTQTLPIPEMAPSEGLPSWRMSEAAAMIMPDWQ